MRSSIATANFFSTLGIKPYRGRVFLPEEEQGDHAVAILSYGLWQRRYAGDARIIGTTIPIDGTSHTVIGIMPPVLDRTMDVQVWRPIAFNTGETSVRRFHFLRLVGRLKPGVTIEQAQRHMDDIARRLEAQYPENEGWHLNLAPYRDVVLGGVGPVLLVLSGAVGVVLLIACGNVASLLLARVGAQRQMAVRTALGAAASRLVRQLLTESLLLGVAAGVAGLILGHYLLTAVRAVGDGMLPRLAEVQIDGVVLAFTFGISLLTSLVFGAAPALHAARTDLGHDEVARQGVRGESRRVDTRRAGGRAGSVVVRLLIGAGLLVRSLWQLQRVETGFDPSRLLAAEISLPPTRYKDRTAIEAFWTQFLDRPLDSRRRIGGCHDALPLAVVVTRTSTSRDSHPASDAQKMNAVVSTVTDDYFTTIAFRSWRAAGSTRPIVVMARV